MATIVQTQVQLQPTSTLSTSLPSSVVSGHKTLTQSLVVRNHDRVREYINRRCKVAYGYLGFSGVGAFLILPILFTFYLFLYWSYTHGVVFIATVLSYNYLENKYHPLGAVGRDWQLFHDFIGALYDKFAKALPIQIIKLAEEEEYNVPGRRLLFCYHPHGVAFLGLCQLQLNFKKYFPTKRCWAMMSNMCFVCPVFRHACFWVGGIPVTKAAAKVSMRTEDVCLCIIPGGLAEMIHADPSPRKLDIWEREGAKVYDNNSTKSEDEMTSSWDEEKKTLVLYLLRRKGFVKMALELGTDLVPVFGFGEIDLFRQPRLGMSWRMRASRVLKLPFTLFYGKLAFYPYESSVNVLIGSPIRVDKVETPTEEMVDQLHSKYVAAIVNIFEKYKGQYNHADARLVVM